MSTFVRDLVIRLSAVLALLFILALLPRCQTAAQAITVGVRIAQDLCKEAEDAGTDPTLVVLTCQIIDAQGNPTTGTATVTMPRIQWAAIKVQATKPSPFDASPGK